MFLNFKILIEKQVEKLDNKLQEKDKEDIRRNSIEYHRLKLINLNYLYARISKMWRRQWHSHSPSILAWKNPMDGVPG